MNSITKPTRKLMLLPTVLVIGLALTACQDTTSPIDSNNAEDSVNMSTETTDLTNSPDANAPVSDAENQLAEGLTAEQKMIDNLARHRWTLTTATEENNQPIAMLMDIKDKVMLSFNQHQGQNTLSYSVGCNTMGAAYQLQGDKLETEESMSTKMSCEDLNAAENRLNKLMQGSSVISLKTGDTPTLTQEIDDSTTLIWTGRLNAQAKYNTKGETIFWAVSSETKPCADNIAKTCLQVKPINYDDQGIKVSEGEWEAFIGSIDGYQHDGKHDEVLRLQRYNLGNGDAADTKYAYVLDTVIESSVAK